MAISTIGTDALAASAVTSTKLASGVPSRSQLPAGTVLQVVNGIQTSTFTTSSTTLVNTSVTATITPSSINSKILAVVNINNISSSDQNIAMFTLVRNGSAIAGTSNTSGGMAQSAGSFGSGGGGYSGGNNNRMSTTAAISYLDSPSSTSALTYTVQMRVSGGTLVFNQWALNTDLGAISTITLMEIAA